MIWPWFWASWALAGITAETVALLNTDDADTLSENTWKWLTHPHDSTGANVLAWVSRVVILGFAAWIGPHLAFGIWTT